MDKLEKLENIFKELHEDLNEFPKECECNELVCDLYYQSHIIKEIINEVITNYELVKKEKKFSEFQEVKYQYNFSGSWFEGIIEKINDDNTYDIKTSGTDNIVKNISCKYIR